MCSDINCTLRKKCSLMTIVTYVYVKFDIKNVWNAKISNTRGPGATLLTWAIMAINQALVSYTKFRRKDLVIR